MNRETVIVIDFGGQYNQLVARRVRECNVYCEIYSYKTDIEKIKAMNPKGIILTGGPNSCYEADSPTYTKELFEYTPMQIKQAIVGYGKADKHQIQEMVRMILHQEKIIRPDDAADAVAVAITHANTGMLREQFRMK